MAFLTMRSSRQRVATDSEGFGFCAFLAAALERSADAVETIARDGIGAAQPRFNWRSINQEEGGRAATLLPVARTRRSWSLRH
jgi:hypothetical protein